MLRRAAVLAVFCLLAPTLALAADAPSVTFAQHGRLIDSGDQPVSGTKPMQFKIWASPVKLPTESAIWTETYSVVIVNGLYGVVIGDTAGNRKVLPLSAFSAGEDRYLTVDIDGSGDLEPRLRIGVMPFAAVAFSARSADEATTAKKALDLDCQGCVGPAELSFDPTPADGSVSTAKLAAGAVTAAKLAENAVGSASIVDGAVAARDLADGAVGSAQLAAAAVTNTKLAAGAVKSENVEDGSITDGKIAAGAIGTTKIADASVTAEKIAAGAVGTAKIADASVTTDKLAAGAITGAKLAAGAISAAQIQAGSLTWDRLEPGQVPASRLPSSPVASKTCGAGEAIRGFDASGNLVCVAALASPKLVDRIGNVARRGIDGLLNEQGANRWYDVPGMVVPFLATGGPVQVSSHTQMSDGSHSSCRFMIDGIPSGVYTGNDTTYRWQEGLTYVSSWWRPWNSSRLIPGIAPGNHTLTMQCFADSDTGGPNLANTSMTDIVSVIPYDLPANAEVKTYTKTIQGGATVGCCSFGTVPGLSTTFQAQGGPIRIALSIPLSGGSHMGCRPLIDGTPAGAGDIDDTSYGWQEGIVFSVGGNWAMFNRNRVYTVGIPTSGSHTATVECRSDSGTLTVGNSRMSSSIGVMTYKAASDSATTVRAYRAVRKIENSYTASSGWVTTSGLSTTFNATGGPIEIGVSVPVYGGSHHACRPIVDGAAITAGEPDDFSYIWHDGITYANGPNWNLWDRIRIYRSISAGSHTLGVQCRQDSGSNGLMGGNSMTSTVWAVAYDP